MVINTLAFVSGLSVLFQLRVLPTPGQLLLLVSGVLLALAVLNFARCRSYLRFRCSRPDSVDPGGVGGMHSGLDTVDLSAITRHHRAIQSITVACAFAIVGFSYSWLHTRALLQQRLPDNLFNQDIVVTGQVAGSTEHDGRRMRFLFRLTQVNPPRPIAEQVAASSAIPPLTVHSLIRLNWYGSATPPLRDGDNLQLVVKLRQPSGFLNPGGFDYEKWLFQHRIVATGYVRDTDRATASWQRNRSRLPNTNQVSLLAGRSWLTQRVRSAASDYSQRGVILALAVGDRSDIEPDQWQRFIATGTNHLLAISGLHITLVATAAGILVKLLWLQLTLLRRAQRQTVVLIAAAIVAFVYSAMAGFAIPTQRALIMFIVLAVFVVARRHHRRQTALSIALIAVVVWNPLSVLSAGFWMSFCAVAILYFVYSSAPREGFRQRVMAVLRGHVLITLGLYPATVLLFHQASLVAPIANFVSVPLVGLVITPAVFFCTLLSAFSVKLAQICLMPVDWLLSLLWVCLGFMANLPLAIIRTGQIAVPILLLVTVAVLLAITPCKAGMRWLFVPLILPVLFSSPDQPQTGSYRVTFLDVGQGSAVVVRTASRVLAYDTGAQFSTSFSAADAVIIPYLRSQRLDKLDALIISHSDNDHSGGVDEILASLDVDRLWHSQPLATFFTGKPAADTASCESGVSWHWDQVRFEFLHPAPDFNGSDNNMSCVLQITSASGERTLLTGDIEREVESILQSSVGPVDILMAPHHGSLTSSSADFVASTRPRYVVHTVGYNNRFGFPKPAVVRRYDAGGAFQISTAASGATTFLVGDGSIEVARYRRQQQKIWHREASDVSAMTATLK